jgi:hypothetical protein
MGQLDRERTRFPPRDFDDAESSAVEALLMGVETKIGAPLRLPRGDSVAIGPFPGAGRTLGAERGLGRSPAAGGGRAITSATCADPADETARAAR